MSLTRKEIGRDILRSDLEMKMKQQEIEEKSKIVLTRLNSQLFVLAMGRTSDADERLKDAALALIWEESYGAVTIDDICNRAEVKKGSFYYFFDLLATTISRFHNKDRKETKRRKLKQI